MNKFVDFIKRNIVLVTVFLCGIICTVILGCMWYNAYDEVEKADAEIRKYDTQATHIYAKKHPVAVKESARIIKENTERLNDKMREFQRHFGYAYRVAFQGFLRTLGTSFTLSEKDAGKADAVHFRMDYKEDAMLDLFKQVYNDYKSKNEMADTNDLRRLMGQRKEIFAKYREAVTMPPKSGNLKNDEERQLYIVAAQKVFDKAFKDFTDKVQAITVEKVTSEDAEQILMDAMGLPRMMTEQECGAFIIEIRDAVLKKPELIPGMKQYKDKGDGKKESSLERLTVEDKVDSLLYKSPSGVPTSTNVVHILNLYKILEDIYRRMRLAGIVRVTEMSRITPLNSPEVENGPVNNLRYQSFSIVIESNIDQVRSFLNMLQEAYKENRIYEVESVSIQNLQSQILSATASLADAKKAITGAGSRGEDFTESANSSAEQKNLDLNRRYSYPLYGKSLLGRETVSAKIVFRYLTYVGDQLEDVK